MVNLRYVQPFEEDLRLDEHRLTNHYIPYIKSRLADDYTYATAIVGERRSGKSSLAVKIALELNSLFNHTYVFYNLRELFKKMKDLKEGDVILMDEAGVSHDAHYWRHWDSEIYKQLTEIWGFKKIIVLYSMPDMSFFQKSQRLMCDQFTIIWKRQYARVYDVRKDFVGGSWKKWSGELVDWSMPAPEIWDPIFKKKQENYESYVSKKLREIEMRTEMEETTRAATAAMDAMGDEARKDAEASADLYGKSYIG